MARAARSRPVWIEQPKVALCRLNLCVPLAGSWNVAPEVMEIPDLETLKVETHDGPSFPI